jgi:hypothetical protein
MTLAGKDLPARRPNFSGSFGKVSVVTESGTKVTLMRASFSVPTDMRFIGQSGACRQFLSVQLT